MKKYMWIISLVLINGLSVFGQTPNSNQNKVFFSDEWSFSVFNNAIAMPFTGKIGIIHAPLHPGFSVGKNHYWNNMPQHQLFQTFTLGVFYQQYVQTGVQLYSAFNYRYQSNFKMGFEAHLGVGYLHAFRDLQQFELNSEGAYQKKANWGQPKLMIPAGITISYLINNKIRPFIGYQIWFQTPFSKQYIPILPNTSLHLGVTMPI